MHNGFCELYVRGGDERAHAKCRKVMGELPAGDRVSGPGPSGYQSG
jgi:hypothetical protein